MQLSGVFLDDNKNPRSEPPHTSGAELDFGGGELELLGVIFGEVNDTWGGTESVDLGVEIAGVDARVLHVATGLLESTDIQVVPVDYELRPTHSEVVDRQSEALPAPATTGLTQPST